MAAIHFITLDRPILTVEETGSGWLFRLEGEDLYAASPYPNAEDWLLVTEDVADAIDEDAPGIVAAAWMALTAKEEA
jgi:hypothetical protein